MNGTRRCQSTRDLESVETRGEADREEKTYQVLRQVTTRLRSLVVVNSLTARFGGTRIDAVGKSLLHIFFGVLRGISLRTHL